MQCSAVCIADIRRHNARRRGDSSPARVSRGARRYFFGLFCLGFLASRLPLSFLPMTPPSAAVVPSQDRNCVLLKSLVVAASWAPNTLFPRSFSFKLANAAFNAASCLGVTLFARPSKARSRSTGISDKNDR